MPRLAQPRKVPRSVYWKRKLDAAPTETARMGEACDYFRGEVRRQVAIGAMDEKTADALLRQESDRLIRIAKQIGRRTRERHSA